MFKSTTLQVTLKSGNHNIQWEDEKEFMWFTIMTSVKTCQEYTYSFPKTQGLSASQEGFCSMELVTQNEKKFTHKLSIV